MMMIRVMMGGDDKVANEENDHESDNGAGFR